MEAETKILIIDDEPQIRELLKKRLELLNYQCEMAENGYEGLKKITQTDYDLVISDIQMPVMDGFEMIKQVRALDADLPVIIILSGHSDKDKLRQAIQQGAQDYLFKPIDFYELELTLKRALDRNRLLRINLDYKHNLEEKVKIQTDLIRMQIKDLEKEISVRKSAEERIQQKLNQLRALREIDLGIMASYDLQLSLNIIMDKVIPLLQMDAADILLFKSPSRILEYVVEKGFNSVSLQNSQLQWGEGLAGRVALEKKMVTVGNLDAEKDEFAKSKRFEKENFITYYGVPLIAKGEVKGVLEIFSRKPLHPNNEWFETFNTLANQAAIAIDNAVMFSDLQNANKELTQAYDSTLEGWSRALDLRDNETEGHTQRVTELTVCLARAMGLNEEELVHIRRGALLHDIGKMGVPDAILLKPGPLTDEEWVIMRKHPVYAYDLLYPIKYLHPALDIPYCHHEKWDGSGYPRGLKGDEIPFGARIFAITDVWDALRSDRPYRKAWAIDKTLEHIMAGRETHFDPKVVDAFLELEF